MITRPGILDYERHALRVAIERLLRDGHDLEKLCRYLPGLANSAANMIRTEAQANNKPPSNARIDKLIQEFLKEREETENH